ncbi:hypothetical protein GCM10011492_07950 [Flexivirga endophytica]|uniref:Uncharacterized protein n=1 Tax=Flexivirga endophytica TaxID=1849103 RepID=A0A916WQM3_9MICO|nr:hypothetical protein GCM10011492_07950 [Flexivirga endophytica]GHB58270.1 hypothetical protein GCM10008112_28970 [Flexivirga endophytica]
MRPLVARIDRYHVLVGHQDDRSLVRGVTALARPPQQQRVIGQFDLLADLEQSREVGPEILVQPVELGVDVGFPDDGAAPNGGLESGDSIGHGRESRAGAE